jgi:hypothetical protein
MQQDQLSELSLIFHGQLTILEEEQPRQGFQTWLMSQSLPYKEALELLLVPQE